MPLATCLILLLLCLCLLLAPARVIQAGAPGQVTPSCTRRALCSFRLPLCSCRGRRPRRTAGCLVLPLPDPIAGHVCLPWLQSCERGASAQLSRTFCFARWIPSAIWPCLRLWPTLSCLCPGCGWRQLTLGQQMRTTAPGLCFGPPRWGQDQLHGDSRSCGGWKRSLACGWAQAPGHAPASPSRARLL